jgi:hypothetical protein
MIDEIPEVLPPRACRSKQCNGDVAYFDLRYANVGVPWSPHHKYTCRACGESISITDRQLQVLFGSLEQQAEIVTEEQLNTIRSFGR